MARHRGLLALVIAAVACSNAPHEEDDTEYMVAIADDVTTPQSVDDSWADPVDPSEEGLNPPHDRGKLSEIGLGLTQLNASVESNASSGQRSDWFFFRTPTVADVTQGIARITTIDPMVDTTTIYKPWAFATDLDGDEAIGSGVIVAKDPMVIVTNTHVVKNAVSVKIEFPALGPQKYNADVRMISPDFDIALLTLTHESDVLSDAAKLQVSLPAVKFTDREPTCPLGVEVLALGYSLGMNELKLSEGIISGSNSDDYFVCTSTAPISPGNCGGPLLRKEGMTIVGLNTASFVTTPGVPRVFWMVVSEG